MADLTGIAPLLEGTFLTALMQDWHQTGVAARNPDKFEEQNPILGEHPHPDKVNAYMPLVGLAQYAGYEAVPDKWKLPYALASALIEGKSAMNNSRKNEGQGISGPNLALGALLTGLLVGDQGQARKNNLGLGLQQVGSAVVPTVNMRW